MSLNGILDHLVIESQGEYPPSREGRVFRPLRSEPRTEQAGDELDFLGTSSTRPQCSSQSSDPRWGARFERLWGGTTLRGSSSSAISHTN